MFSNFWCTSSITLLVYDLEIEHTTYSADEFQYPSNTTLGYAWPNPFIFGHIHSTFALPSMCLAYKWSNHNYRKIYWNARFPIPSLISKYGVEGFMECFWRLEYQVNSLTIVKIQMNHWNFVIPFKSHVHCHHHITSKIFVSFCEDLGINYAKSPRLRQRIRWRSYRMDAIIASKWTLVLS